MKTKNKKTGIMVETGFTESESEKDKNKEKDEVKTDIVFKSLDIGVESGTDASLTAFSYAIPPVEMDKLYTLYKEDETIAAVVDKTAKVASSEKITFKGKDADIKKAEEIMKACYLILSKSESGSMIRKRMMSKEFFKYLFTDSQIYNNCYFEVRRSLDKSAMVFVYKDPRYIRVLKNHLGFVELEGSEKFFYNNYTPDKKERAEHRIHYEKGYMKGDDKIPELYRREIVHIRGYGNEYYGLSQLYSIGTSSLLQMRAKNLPINFLKNGMVNTPIITFSGADVSKPNKDEIKSKFKYQATGNDNVGTPIILFTTVPGSKVEVTGMPRHQFDLKEVKDMYKLGESNVIKRFGIPPEKVSIIEHSNKATITEADEIMTEEIINPLQSLFEFQMNIIFQEDLGLNVDLNFADKIYNIEQLSKVSRQVRGMTLNEIREKILNLEKKDDPLADEIILSASDRLLSEDPKVPAVKDAPKKIKSLKDTIVNLLKLRKQYESKND